MACRHAVLLRLLLLLLRVLRVLPSELVARCASRGACAATVWLGPVLIGTGEAMAGVNGLVRAAARRAMLGSRKCQ
jgi:hypothetical protein